MQKFPHADNENSDQPDLSLAGRLYQKVRFVTLRLNKPINRDVLASLFVCVCVCSYVCSYVCSCVCVCCS